MWRIYINTHYTGMIREVVITNTISFPKSPKYSNKMSPDFKKTIHMHNSYTDYANEPTQISSSPVGESFMTNLKHRLNVYTGIRSQ